VAVLCVFVSLDHDLDFTGPGQTWDRSIPFRLLELASDPDFHVTELLSTMLVPSPARCTGSGRWNESAGPSKG
jgi:hypothetical protein